MSQASGTGERLFLVSAAAALGVHALVLARGDGLQGGADLQPHLRLMQLMAEAPALRNPYAPAYHVLGALLGPAIGWPAYTKLVAFAGAAGLIAGFRCFQRAAGLPPAAAAVFTWTPYLFALSWCLPKLETAGYALAFTGLAFLLRRRRVGAGAMLALAFCVHTAGALFLGLAGGVLALALRDARALGALAVGSLAGAGLIAVHLQAGCSFAEALLFSQGDYLRRATQTASFVHWPRLVALAGLPALLAAGLGVPELVRRHRTVSVLAALVLLLYLNELWLLPFGTRTTLDLLRGQTLLAFPVAAAAGVAFAGRPRWQALGLAVCAAWALVCIARVVPDSCTVRSIDPAWVERLSVDRCAFRWRLALPAPDGGGAHSRDG
jgi:hypothetical protein